MGEWVARREKCIKSASKRGFQQAVWICIEQVSCCLWSWGPTCGVCEVLGAGILHAEPCRALFIAAGKVCSSCHLCELQSSSLSLLLLLSSDFHCNQHALHEPGQGWQLSLEACVLQAEIRKYFFLLGILNPILCFISRLFSCTEMVAMWREKHGSPLKLQRQKPVSENAVRLSRFPLSFYAIEKSSRDSHPY